ncbi:MAG TPA: DinB family protein [Acidimicrobiia bacterium]|nr:DinB family protein [Acidimicrobiia bacterium]
MPNTEHLGGRAEERAMLNGFLDWYRAVVDRKVEGLPLEDATRVGTPTGLSPLGVVAHLAAVEVGWFDETFAGLEVDPIWDDHGAFRLHDDDTVESVLAEYRRACERSREVVAAAPSLNDLGVRSDEYRGQVSLRWILVHMIEETARHAGHLDIMREAIDGRTGD